MTRYTINIGDDFPLGGGGDEAAPGEPPDGRHRRRRHGLFLRVLFFLALAAIVMTHPLKTLLVVGVVLLIRRSHRFAGFRERLGAAWRSGMAHDWRREAERCRDNWSVWQSRWRGRCGDRQPPQADRPEEHDRYRGFV